jgi:tRNA-splicing ligase RtcB
LKEIMKTFKFENGQPTLFSWCPNPEDGVLRDMAKIAALPFVKHLALMPDAHVGMEMPIGGVVACENVIVPQFVGVDIGCGMASMKTNIQRDYLRGKEADLLQRLSAAVPVGFAHNSKEKIAALRAQAARLVGAIDTTICTRNRAPLNQVDPMEAVLEQVGTLGGGNHFLELQEDEYSGKVYAMVHSGSRNIGKQVCDHFTKVAANLNARWYSKSEIPFLPTTSDEGQEYLRWMAFSLQFSKLNKVLMLESVQTTLLEAYPELGIEFDEPVIIHHNYAALENHLGHNWWVHRKGATSAKAEHAGIIPGSMGTPSYLTRGLGNVLSLTSSSHGAGRRMGRMDFNRSIDSAAKREEVEKSLTGVTHLPFTAPQRRKRKEHAFVTTDTRSLIDCSEAPGAYKDIDEVMENQKDLVQGVIKLTPFLCLKG